MADVFFLYFMIENWNPSMFLNEDIVKIIWLFYLWNGPRGHAKHPHDYVILCNRQRRINIIDLFIIVISTNSFEFQFCLTLPAW